VKKNKKLIIYAPNIRSSGGLNFLYTFVNKIKRPIDKIYLHKDNLILKNSLSLDIQKTINKGLFFRLFAEFSLLLNSNKNTTVVCVHGLPPIFFSRAENIVILQNRLLFEKVYISNVGLYRYMRLKLEKCILILASLNVSRFYVFTESMFEIVKTNNFLKNKLHKVDFEFINKNIPNTYIKNKKFDLIYPATADFHKNHKNLIRALILLSHDNFYPSLVITILRSDNEGLYKFIYNQKKLYKLNIIFTYSYNNNDFLIKYLARSRALIYPSLCESVGMPLLEASFLNVPILASEKDFVRDIVMPVETFDPDSPVSIARAIKRFFLFKSSNSQNLHSLVSYVNNIK
jgi:glycosyltransferase involved in cell wall biosynthesis